MKITKVIVITPKRSRNGKKKFTIIHDMEITPPRYSDQILPALKQQYEILNYTIEFGTATIFVRKKQTDETE